MPAVRLSPGQAASRAGRRRHHARQHGRALVLRVRQQLVPQPEQPDVVHDGRRRGFLRQGQVLKFPGRSVSDIHVTLGNAFGIRNQTFGDPAFSTGPIAPFIA